MSTNPADAQRTSARTGTGAPELGERLRPTALLPPGTSAVLAAGGALAILFALGLVLVAVSNLPAGLGLLLVVAPLVAWGVLALRAVRANRTVRHLVARGHLVRGRVTAVEPDGRLRYRFHVIPLDDEEDGDGGAPRALTDEALEACRQDGALDGVSRWALVRYHEGMQVGVVFDPDDPARNALLPPPGGGTAGDLVADVVAALLRRTASPPPPPRPPSVEQIDESL